MSAAREIIDDLKFVLEAQNDTQEFKLRIAGLPESRARKVIEFGNEKLFTLLAERRSIPAIRALCELNMMSQRNIANFALNLARVGEYEIIPELCASLTDEEEILRLHQLVAFYPKKITSTDFARHIHFLSGAGFIDLTNLKASRCVRALLYLIWLRRDVTAARQLVEMYRFDGYRILGRWFLHEICVKKNPLTRGMSDVKLFMRASEDLDDDGYASIYFAVWARQFDIARYLIGLSGLSFDELYDVTLITGKNEARLIEQFRDELYAPEQTG